MVFMKFLKDNQRCLMKFQNGKVEKYVRDPWMMKTHPPVDEFEEIMRKEETSF